MVVLGTDAFQEHVLMIRDLSVVQDATRTWNPCTGGNPTGVWTFNHLMTNNANQAASGIDPAIYTENWLANFTTPPTINGHTVSTRNAGPILAAWPKRTDGHIDLTKSPFRLLAIVPRVDLRRTTGGGGSYTTSTSGNFIDGGEARFVFGLMQGCSVKAFAVIFEYRVPKCGCTDVKAWAQQWVALNGLAFGAPYNAALQNLTEQYAKVNANPARPNGSSPPPGSSESSNSPSSRGRCSTRRRPPTPRSTASTAARPSRAGCRPRSSRRSFRPASTRRSRRCRSSSRPRASWAPTRRLRSSGTPRG
jgi:hypothetical protein